MGLLGTPEKPLKKCYPNPRTRCLLCRSLYVDNNQRSLMFLREYCTSMTAILKVGVNEISVSHIILSHRGPRGSSLDRAALAGRPADQGCAARLSRFRAARPKRNSFTKNGKGFKVLGTFALNCAQFSAFWKKTPQKTLTHTSSLGGIPSTNTVHL